jgi:hypothetical protein
VQRFTSVHLDSLRNSSRTRRRRADHDSARTTGASGRGGPMARRTVEAGTPSGRRGSRRLPCRRGRSEQIFSPGRSSLRLGQRRGDLERSWSVTAMPPLRRPSSRDAHGRRHRGDRAAGLDAPAQQQSAGLAELGVSVDHGASGACGLHAAAHLLPEALYVVDRMERNRQDLWIGCSRLITRRLPDPAARARRSPPSRSVRRPGRGRRGAGRSPLASGPGRPRSA